MRPIKPHTDIEPVWEFREEPMVKTIELLGDVRTAMRQIEMGEGLSNRDAKSELRKRFSRRELRR